MQSRAFCQNLRKKIESNFKLHNFEYEIKYSLKKHKFSILKSSSLISVFFFTICVKNPPSLRSSCSAGIEIEKWSVVGELGISYGICVEENTCVKIP